MKTLEQMYAAACAAPTDIHEHLPVLRSLASQVRHVTEFGVRNGQSTIALLAGQPEVMRSYDIQDLGVGAKLAPVRGRTDFSFTLGDTRTIAIEPTDLLFIDTLHTYDQLKLEFDRHQHAVSKWIVMHDTTTFGQQGEHAGTRGLWPAVEELLAAGAWRLHERRSNNNGLTTLERA